jgi:hypothetical protein
MALIEDEQRTLIIGVVAGIAAAGLVKYLGPAFSGTGRPLLKGLIKTGLTTFETGRETFAQASEVIEDLFVEARAELDAEAKAATGDQPLATVPRPNGGA